MTAIGNRYSALIAICLWLAAFAVPVAAKVVETKIENPESGSIVERMGCSVAADGDTMIVGAFETSIGELGYVGSARIYLRDATGKWSLQATLTPPSPEEDLNFGRAVAIDGDTAVVTAPGAGSRFAYVYVRGGTKWTLQSPLLNPDYSITSSFGDSAAISGDTVVIGEPSGNTVGIEGRGCAHVYTRSGTAWSFQATLKPGDPAIGDKFGYSVAVDGNTVVAGSYMDDDAGNASGSAYVFTRSGTAWSQQAKLTATDAAAQDLFGMSVAVAGDTAMIGSTLDDTTAANTGSVYVFARSGTKWTQKSKLTAGDARANEMFGNTVAISGTTAAVGALRDAESTTSSGSVYVFAYNGSKWLQQAKLQDSGATNDDGFGICAAVSGDTVAVGAIAKLGGGAAYAFKRSGTTWSRQAILTPAPNTGATHDHFGRGVAISNNTMIVGVDGDSDYAGLAYVYTRSGSVWSRQATLKGADTDRDDSFGRSVAIDGDTAVVGAIDARAGNSYAGAAYVFTRSGSAWSQQAKLIPSDTPADADFGMAVSISGGTVVVGSQAGKAYVFVRSGSAWSQQAILTSDATADDGFGQSVSVSGGTAIVGAGACDDKNTTDSGAAFIFVRSGTKWSQQAKLLAADRADEDYFGSAVAISGETVLVGAPGKNVSSGVVYVYTRGGAAWSRQAVLTASDGGILDEFGNSVALSGNTAAIGAYNTEGETGAGYIFTRAGTAWFERAILKASDRDYWDSFGSVIATTADKAVVGACRNDDPEYEAGAAYAYKMGSFAPYVTSASAQSQTSMPTWNWISAGAGGTGTFRWQLNGTGSGGWKTTKATSWQPATGLPNDSYTLYVQEQGDDGDWSASGSFTVDVQVKNAVPGWAAYH